MLCINLWHEKYFVSRFNARQDINSIPKILYQIAFSSFSLLSRLAIFAWPYHASSSLVSTTSNKFQYLLRQLNRMTFAFPTWLCAWRKTLVAFACHFDLISILRRINSVNLNLFIRTYRQVNEVNLSIFNFVLRTINTNAIVVGERVDLYFSLQLAHLRDWGLLTTALP